MTSGNRMPVILFLFGLFLVYFFNKKLRKIILINSIILLAVLGAIISSSNQLKTNFSSLYGNGQETLRVLFERIKASEDEVMQKEKEQFLNESAERDGYTKIIATGIETWKLHKVFGNGIKAFRIDCKIIIEQQKRGACGNHPHNYHLEILTDLGIVGYVVIIILAFIFILFLVKNNKFLNGENLASLFLLAAIISLTLEVFPIKSSGSIFSTNNTAYVILMSGIILSRKKILEGKNFG
jgi:O-antigen ligase